MTITWMLYLASLLVYKLAWMQKIQMHLLARIHLLATFLKQNFFRTIIAQFGCKPCNFLWAFMSQNKPSVYVVPTYLFLTDGAAATAAW